MEDPKKMLITEKNGNEIEVDVVTSFYNKDESRQYVMYTKGEKQGENTIVYVSIISKEDDKIYLDDIESDEEWLSVKSIIKEMLAKMQ